jgi:hypothetical protein
MEGNSKFKMKLNIIILLTFMAYGLKTSAAQMTMTGKVCDYEEFKNDPCPEKFDIYQEMEKDNDQWKIDVTVI